MQNKLVLYGAKKLADFKEKLKVYETIRKKNMERRKVTQEKDDTSKKTERARNPTIAKKVEKEQDSGTRCYNCGAKGHKSKDCNKKELGKKCFRCQKFGHTANQCNTTDESTTDKKVLVVNAIALTTMNRMYKQITVNGTRLEALIDTGS